MPPELAVVVLLVAAVAVLLFQGVAILFAYEMPRLDPVAPVAARVTRPRVSVIVAARNEELDLPATLDDLLAQDYAPELEILVVEGGSTDGTRAVIDARSPRVRHVPEPPLPPGWIGKNWACAVGAGAATGDWLLFVDADVRLDPSAVRVAVDWAIAERADLATLATRIDMRSFWEWVVMPFYVQMVLTVFRTPRVNHDASTAAMANGQFWLTPAATYTRVGGHESVRGAVVEDVAIARRYRAGHLRLRVAWAPSLAQTRMYRDRHEMFEGLVRTTQGSGESAARLFGDGVAIILLFLLPFALLPIGIAAGSVLLTAVGAFLWVAIFGKHVGFDAAIGGRPVYGLLVPLSAVFYVAVVWTATVHRLRRAPVRWKDRTYDPNG